MGEDNKGKTKESDADSGEDRKGTLQGDYCVSVQTNTKKRRAREERRYKKTYKQTWERTPKEKHRKVTPTAERTEKSPCRVTFAFR